MSTSYEWAQIRTYWQTAWTACATDWSANSAFDPDKSAHTAPYSAGLTWAKLSVLPISSEQLWTIGVSNAYHERRLWIDFFAPVNSGQDTVLGYAKTARDLLWDADIGALDFRVPEMQTLGLDEGERWWRERVVCPYYYEELKGESNVPVWHEREVTQAGFFATAAVGSLVRANGATWALAQADDSDTVATHIVSRVISDDRGALTAPGSNVAWTGHGAAAGARLYTSASTPGGITSTAPNAPNYVQQVGGVNADGTIWFFLFPHYLGASA